MTGFQRISVDEANQLLGARDCLLLDCRDEMSYRMDHLDNAVHAGDDTLKSLVQDGDRDQPLVIYCYHGNSSQQLAGMLGNAGFNEVYSVDGGFESWRPQR